MVVVRDILNGRRLTTVVSGRGDGTCDFAVRNLFFARTYLCPYSSYIYIYMCIYIHMQCLLASNQYAYAYDGVALLSKVNMRRIFNAGSAYYYVGLLYVMCPHH